MKEALIVQGPSRMGNDNPRYFILCEIQERVETAALVIVGKGEHDKDVGMGMFFTRKLAVTCDQNLTDEYRVGSWLPLALKNEMANGEVAIHNTQVFSDFIPSWNGKLENAVV